MTIRPVIIMISNTSALQGFDQNSLMQSA